MANKGSLDFAIIGAQKGGTTTVFQLLMCHPEITMPREKEGKYLLEHSPSVDESTSYIDLIHKATSEGKLAGDVSPQYMFFSSSPQLLYNHNHKIKIIAIIRDPVERALSAYRMKVKLDLEHRTFKECWIDYIKAAKKPIPIALDESDYFSPSRYSEIIPEYQAVFGENLLILDFYDLKHKPEHFIKCIQNFLGVKEIIPNNIRKAYHVGGAPYSKIFNRILDFLSQNKGILPKSVIEYGRGSIYWARQLNTKKIEIKQISDTIEADTLREMSEYFINDYIFYQRNCHNV